MTNQTAFITPIHDERWEITLRVPGQPVKGTTLTTHSIPPCVRAKMAALDITGYGDTPGLGWRSFSPQRRGEHFYEVYLTQAEADELAQCFRGILVRWARRNQKLRDQHSRRKNNDITSNSRGQVH